MQLWTDALGPKSLLPLCFKVMETGIFSASLCFNKSKTLIFGPLLRPESMTMDLVQLATPDQYKPAASVYGSSSMEGKKTEKSN
jgi:hypothetical protein